MTDWPKVSALYAETIHVEKSEFSALRGVALATYGALEKQLVQVMRVALQVDYNIAHIVFHRTITTRTRYAIILDSFAFINDGQFVPAWKKLQKWLLEIDERRNQLVHWSPEVMYIADVNSGETRTEDVLKRLTGNLDAMHTESSLIQFISDARIMINLVNRLWYPFQEVRLSAWHEAYLQPLDHLHPIALLEVLNNSGPPNLRTRPRD